MAEQRPQPQQRKRKRRRQDKSSITARLVLDDHVRGDVGILSEDLFADLFPAIQGKYLLDLCYEDGSEANAVFAAEPDGSGSSGPEILHVAISPWTPAKSVEDSAWTVVPVRSSSALAHSTVQFSPSSLALQGFADALQRVAPSKLSSHSRSGIEIRVLDVVPMPLETVFVTIEADLARRLENGEGIFHGEHVRTNGKRIDKPSSVAPEGRLAAAIREALGTLQVVHTGDFFPLPLAPHPITHVPPPPAQVTLCEPVGQGILSPTSKIIITQTGHHSKQHRKPQALEVDRPLNGMENGEEDDASTDQFYSATEDRYKTDTAVGDDDSATETETETEISDAEEDDLSDDSMDDLISLQVPMLPAHNASGISTVQPGSPRTVGRVTNGINTPGSIFSSFTATTARAGGSKGRLFKAQGLMRQLPEEILHPKPNADDDEEARVFVDVNSLTKIGCFSGDWVRLEVASEPPAHGSGLWGLGSFGNIELEDTIWRPVKVFGLPEGYSQRPITKIPSNKQGERRMSFFDSQIQKPSSPTVYLSPILLANMENMSYCRLSPLKRLPQTIRASQPKITSSSRPPFAQELTLVKIATPLSTERTLQNILFANLKDHFTHRTRIVRKGDLVAIPIDEDLGRTLYQPSANDDLDVDDLLSNSGLDNSKYARPIKHTAVAWFRIGFIRAAKEDQDSAEEEDVWGGTSSVDGPSTRILQSGSEGSRVPASLDNPWEYYLRLKSTPKSEILASSLSEARRPHITSLQRRLRELIAAATSPQAIHLQQQPLAILLVSTQRNIGKSTLAAKACADIGLHTFSIDAYDIVTEGGAGSDVKTVAYLESRAERAMSCGSEFCSFLIRHIEAFTADRMISTLKEILSGLRVLIATTTEVDKIPDGVRGLFTHELEMTAPDEWEREGILRNIIDDQPIPLAPEVDLGAVAVKTAALVAGDLVDVVDRAIVARNSRLESLVSSSSGVENSMTVRDILVAGGPAGRCLTKADFDIAVEAARKNFADAIGAPKIPNVGWDDVGGLTNVKDAVMETIQLPLERPELFAKGMKKRSGILFYGPPGTGKTLLAKAIATEFSLNFFSVKGPELLNMYIGESEANVRRVFQRARDARPCVVFFDELDSVAPKRGNQGDSGGVMDRIVSQLLAELDGMSDGEDGGGGVFVIGATNRPDLLDAALLRPGRFDKMLYLGVSDTHEKQLTIMEALTRKFTLHPSLSLARVASHLPFTYTGADFYALCSDAMLKAVTRQASLVDAKIAAINASAVTDKPKISTAYFFDHYATKDDVDVVVTEEDFINAEKELVPSVSQGELVHYQRVRAQFEKVEEKKPDLKGKGKAIAIDGPISEVNGRPMSSVKEKGKGKIIDRKGKGKAVERWDDPTEDYEDEGINGFDSRPAMKGKAVDMGFQQGSLDDDEELY
ncbi:p-loop containing nucleoside triphosphate hydrolase [Venustampulla echinocandica]|uniref:Peroxisomal ATPase PEX6 n=1 Tax=Venustampulla echinocandica TaxID=2656787 RepID=A0A370TS64_9HELO|nr:p-loop containing nucleoside triphosphate hydrolase [Venustampulla echinocandica]RDL38361.1 p-loop containing nucleoside triphosphate hydrolase [Venustampulla echinocandica]